MNNRIRIPLYIVLVILASVSGYYALTNFGSIMNRAADRNEGVDQIEPERKPAVEEAVLEPTADTNAATAQVGTNAAALTNAAGTLTNTAMAATNTNTVASVEPGTKAPKTRGTAVVVDDAAEEAPGGGRIGLWLGVFVLSLVLLGLIIANDVSHFMGGRALKTLYNDEGEGQKNVGSSRVDLQACKLEYSIVSPK